MIIIDSHQDLAWNMLTFQRDYTRSANETRRLEAASQAPALVGDTLLGWPDYVRGNVALIFSTIFAAPARFRQGEWDSQCYADRREAIRLYTTQLDAYHRLVNDDLDKFRLVCTQAEAVSLVDHWDTLSAVVTPESHSEDSAHPPASVGLVILMEGAEVVGEPSDLEEWWERGVRVIGPAWAGTRFCGGTNLAPLIPILLAGLRAVEEAGGAAGVVVASLVTFTRFMCLWEYRIRIGVIWLRLSPTRLRRHRKPRQHFGAAVVDQVSRPAAL